MKVQGACHCGTVRFEAEWDASFAYRCNCSLCRRKNALMATVPKAAFTVLQGADALGLYQWNKKIAEHYFCSVCGIYTHHGRRSDPTQMGFNVNCLEGFDPATLEVIELDGASLD